MRPHPVGGILSRATAAERSTLGNPAAQPGRPQAGATGARKELAMNIMSPYSRATGPITIYLLLMALIGSVNAQSSSRAFWEGPAPGRQARIAQAQEWRNGFRILDQQIPTLSPAEAAWIKREYDDQITSNGGKFTPRAIEAMNSKEFQARRARQHLDLLMPIIGRLAGRAYGNEREEVTDWARFASLMMDGPFWSATTDLVKRGLVKPEINGVSDFHQDNQHSVPPPSPATVVSRIGSPRASLTAKLKEQVTAARAAHLRGPRMVVISAILSKASKCSAPSVSSYVQRNPVG
jgi:hypothetical protein